MQRHSPGRGRHTLLPPCVSDAEVLARVLRVTRLEQQWPEFTEQFTALDGDRQLQIAMRGALASLDSVGSPVPEGDEPAVRAEVDRLDALSWDIQDDASARSGDYELAFRKARAMNAFLLAAFQGNATEALYETLHALGAPEEAAFLLDL